MIDSISGCSRCTFGMPLTMEATCFTLTSATVTVDAVSGFAVTASTARTTFAAVGNVLAVWVRTRTEVTPSTPHG